MKKETWVVVANSSIAYIYKLEKKHLEEIDVLKHPESRLRNRDIVGDKPGRDFESMGTLRHSLEPHHTPHEQEVILFAKELAHYLEAARNRNEVEKFYLAASPIMLGLLRQSLDASTVKLITGEIDKDLTQLKPEEMVEHFSFSY